MPAESPSVGEEFSMVKSVAADPRVSVFPASSIDPTVNMESLLIVVSSIIFITVLLPVVTSSRVRLPATSNVPFERLSQLAPVNTVLALVCNMPEKSRFAVCKASVEFLLFTVPETEPPF